MVIIFSMDPTHMRQETPKAKKISDGIRIKNSVPLPAREKTMRESEKIFSDFAREHAFDQEVTETDGTADQGPLPAVFLAPRRRRGARNSRLPLWGFGAGLFAIAAAILFFSTAGARMTIWIKPRIEDVSLRDIAVHFDTAVAKTNAGDKVVPAERLVLTKTLKKDFSSTGNEKVDEHARGGIKIYNQFSSSPQSLVKNTRFVSDAGILFRLTQGITVPGAKIADGKIVPESADAQLVADGAGEKSNVSGPVRLLLPGFLGSPKYDGFFAQAPQGFSGGISGTVRVASTDDIARAQEQVTKELSARLESEMKGKMPQGLVYQNALRDIQITRVDAPAPHTPGDTFSVSAAASGRVLAFRPEDIEAIIDDVAVGEDRTRAIIPGSAAIEYAVRNIDFDSGRADALMRGSVKTKAVVPVQELASLVAGKKQGSIADLLRNRQDIESFTLSFFPPWRISAPGDPAKVRLIIQ